MSTSTDAALCLNCGHTFDLHSDGYFCYARPDGTLSPILTGQTCRCGYWNPPVEPEPEVPGEPEPEPNDGTPAPGDSEPDA